MNFRTECAHIVKIVLYGAYKNGAVVKTDKIEIIFDLESDIAASIGPHATKLRNMLRSGELKSAILPMDGVSLSVELVNDDGEVKAIAASGAVIHLKGCSEDELNGPEASMRFVTNHDPDEHAWLAGQMVKSLDMEVSDRQPGLFPEAGER